VLLSVRKTDNGENALCKEHFFLKVLSVKSILGDYSEKIYLENL